ncbi:MAG: histidine triad protein [Myxococcales bacterium]|nr:histidine triad protein [Myxococcales bacterium]
MGCVFCGIVAGETDASVVMRDAGVVAFLDATPLFKGHVLVVPTAHVVTLADVPPAELAPLFAGVQKIARALPAALGAQGTFVALNNVVSQSVPHLHVHVVPRTKGDGLKGFFWPRTKYADVAERDAYAAKIAAALT